MPCCARPQVSKTIKHYELGRLSKQCSEYMGQAGPLPIAANPAAAVSAPGTIMGGGGGATGLLALLAQSPPPQQPAPWAQQAQQLAYAQMLAGAGAGGFQQVAQPTPAALLQQLLLQSLRQI